MSDTVIQVDNVWKKYQLGVLGTGTLRHDLNRWWHRVRGKPDPYAKVSVESPQKIADRRSKMDAPSPISDLPSPSSPESEKLSEDEIWALQGVSFEVKQGEILGIIGRNGAGKSTLLKILSRTTAPTTGEVRVKGRIASLLEVGTGFHPELTGRENIFLNGAILGMTKGEIKRKLDEIVDFSGVERYINTPVKRYSSGMYVRLAFAVAAHLEPEILIVDEVLAVGDAAFQKKCIGKMGEVSHQGRTVLFVSHNLEAVRKLCTRAVLLEGGEVVLAGSTDSVLGKYINSDSSLRTTFSIPPPPQKDASAIATELVVENLEGLPSNGFSVGEPWQIRISFTIVRRMDHFIAAIGLVSDRDISVWTSWSKPHDLQPGHYQAVFLNEQVSLCAGSFSLTVGLSSHLRTIHYIEEAGSLVLAEASKISTAIKVNGDCGFIVNPMSVTIESVSNPSPYDQVLHQSI